MAAIRDDHVTVVLFMTTDTHQLWQRVSHLAKHVDQHCAVANMCTILVCRFGFVPVTPNPSLHASGRYFPYLCANAVKCLFFNILMVRSYGDGINDQRM